MVQNRLGHRAFGQLSALSALALVAAAVADLGLTQYTTRRTATDPSFLPDHFPILLPLRGWLGLVFLLGLLGLGAALGYDQVALGWLALLTISLLLTQHAQFLRGVAQGRQWFRLDSVLSVFEKALLLALVVGLLAASRLTLGTYVGVRVGAAALAVGIFSVVMARKLGGWVRPRLRPAPVRALLRGALPLALITLLYGLNERLDMVMLERLAGPRETGLYAAAYRWTDAAMMYLWTVLPLFFARFAAAGAPPTAASTFPISPLVSHPRTLPPSNPPTLKPSHPQTLPPSDPLTLLLSVGQRVVTAPVLWVVAFVLMRGDVLLWQLTASTPAELARITLCLQLLFLNVLVNAFFAIYSTLLTSTRWEKAVSWLIAGSIGLNAALNALLLARPEWWGGAVAGAANTLLCAVVVSGGYVWLVARRTGVQVPWAHLLRLALVFGALLGAWFGLKTALNNWWLESLLTGLLWLLLLPLTGLVSKKEIRGGGSG